MRKPITDAEFEVIAGPYRLGDPHPTNPRARFIGVDERGAPLWRAPPRFNRMQFALALLAALAAGRLLLGYLWEMLRHARTY